jgi:hypothetical protein
MERLLVSIGISAIAICGWLFVRRLRGQPSKRERVLLLILDILVIGLFFIFAAWELLAWAEILPSGRELVGLPD